ncbi:ABC transporter ATP-binding protein [Sediminispirochaeta smaragdinae]|uniref:Oligopeptide/dipeptide ABC transporter, ATPase subunit n=1 Tax=Sediminispirochaeta smaragdinae (strain DSM 11293 / JCM 15392 / SEBR 4228) TaxID=573413 RepID=E1R4D7_SEDSS|nr:ABC transporter ATP-binding protein [Sediminispirochaeta smaragdinae]ADK81678.1 oligopeptide/dipeptide ABC transporter, ATPase subunit [Sediminispirochaeta smaragdinae DSM 11293]
MEAPLIETRGLKKYFKTRAGLLHAVDDVNLTIKKGETLGVVGESGCGKSTLGRTILRLLEPTEGEILYDGSDIVGYNRRQMKTMRAQMQMIFQDPFTSLNARMSISEIISDPMKVIGNVKGKKKIKETVKEIMDLCGLPERYVNTYPHELDGGRRQRVGLARALAVDPDFIVCDEPVSALDVSIQAQILNLLMDLQDQRGLAYMFITHDLCVVRHISDYIAVMYLGQVVEYATRDELFSNHLHPYTKALLSAIPTTDLSRKNRERHLLQGEVGNPIDPAPGCRFTSRCRFASERCKEVQQFREVSSGHFVRCILVD